MWFVLLIMSIIVAGYYILLISYAGKSAAFSKFYLILSIVLFLTSAAIYIMGIYGIVIHTYIRVPIYIAALIITILFTIIELRLISYARKVPVKDVDYIIILGARVRGIIPSRSLKERIEAAYNYAKDNDKCIIIASGGMGEGELITEAQAIMNYLVSLGMDKNRIILEEKSTTTKENLSYSMELMENEQKSVAIATSGYHIYRSIKLAKNIGLCNVCGIASRPIPIYELNMYIREFFAVVKEYIFHNI